MITLTLNCLPLQYKNDLEEQELSHSNRIKDEIRKSCQSRVGVVDKVEILASSG
jgi:hypothetical protein